MRSMDSSRRRTGQKSNLGAWLDPMADKLLLLTTFVVLDAAWSRPREPTADLADRAHLQPRRRHRADGGHREPGHRASHVPPVDLRQGRDGDLHRDGRGGDVLQLSRLSARRSSSSSSGRRSRSRSSRASTTSGMRGRSSGREHEDTKKQATKTRRRHATKTRRHEEEHSLAQLPVFVSSWPSWPVRVFVLRGTFFVSFSFVPLQRSPGRPSSKRPPAPSSWILLPEAAPAQVAHFVKLAQDGAYDGTTFHRMVQARHRAGRRSDFEGSGEAEPLRHRRPERRQGRSQGGEDDARVGGRRARSRPTGQRRAPSSSSSIVDQPGLDGQYTVFARVWDGIEVLQKISETPVDATGLATERVEIRRVSLRDTPAEPFSPSRRRNWRPIGPCSRPAPARSPSNSGPTRRPGHVRQFLRLAQAGVYDGMAFHRVAPGFVIQTGALSSRQAPLTERQQTLVVNLQPEFSDTPHVQGRGVDGARRRSGERQHVVLHLHGDLAGTRRQVHGVRPCRRRHGRGRGDRARPADRRNAEREDAAARKTSESAKKRRGTVDSVLRSSKF